jgi:hypothetical protein
MELTSGTLLATAGIVCAAGLTALVLMWRRWGGRLVVLRAVGILACELLIVVTAGLAINRWGEFYPTWSSLRDDPSGASEPAVQRPDPGLTAAAPDGAQVGYLLRWPATPLGMTGPPLVWLPPSYFREPTEALPVVVVVAGPDGGPADGAWSGNEVPVGDRPAGGCVVFVRVSAQPASGLLTLPAELVRDLHVATHGWGAVGIGTAAPTAHRLATADAVRFGRVVEVGTPDGRADLAGALNLALSETPPALAPPLVLPTLALTEGL